MVESGSDQQIGYLLRSYPRLSQTFIVNEILALEAIGVPIEIFALTDPHEKVVQRQIEQVRAAVHYLDEAMRSRRETLQENLEVARRHFKGYIHALLYLASNRKIDQGYKASNRWKCFLQAIHLVYLLEAREQRTGKTLRRLHAHFAHDPALVAYLAHCLTGIPFSFTAHARDLYQVPEEPLRDRIRQASAVVTCCRANLDYLTRIAPSQRSKFALVYHGVNLKDFQPASGLAASPPAEVPVILSVGRLVEKKGFQDLLQALLLVKVRGIRFRCMIYGDGPLCKPLQRWVVEHGLGTAIVLNGDRTQRELIPAFQSASLFVLTPIQTEDGDRDGIPNVLLEAMAVGLPVVTTSVAGIPELVDHDRNGLLYAPHDVEGIASGIVALLQDTERRRHLGNAAAKKVAEQFDIAQSAQRLKTLFS
jgi:glycosyltransferase involved in cell wall biosynthesis